MWGSMTRRHKGGKSASRILVPSEYLIWGLFGGQQNRVMIQMHGEPSQASVGILSGLLALARTAESAECRSSPSAEYSSAEGPEETEIIKWRSGLTRPAVPAIPERCRCRHHHPPRDRNCLAQGGVSRLVAL